MLTVADIMQEVGDHELYTLHAHTQFCDARMPMEEFASAAASAGFTHYGFTPHSPIPLDSPCNMKHEDVAKYFAEAERIKESYPQIRFFRGMEVDYLGSQWGPANSYFNELGLDYIIGSVHFIQNQEGEYYDIDGRPDTFKRRLEENFHGDLKYVVETYFKQSMQMIAEGGFQIIGHMDKIKLNAGSVMPELETTDWYKRQADELVEAVIEMGCIVEINTKSMKEYGHLFPSQKYWRKLINAGTPIIVNSDAHYTDRINASRMEVIKALKYLINQQISK